MIRFATVISAVTCGLCAVGAGVLFVGGHYVLGVLFVPVAAAWLGVTLAWARVPR